MQHASVWLRTVALVVAASGWGCGGGQGGTPGDAGTPDGSMPGGPDSGGDDGGTGDPSPFPSDPTGGEFAWVVSAPGAGDPVSVAVDPAGSILVVATQTGEVTLGGVHVPAPAGQALLVLKLTSDGKPTWGRSFTGATAITGRAITATSAGDVVVGGEFEGSRLQVGNQVIASAGQGDGFVIVLDGRDGTPRWVAPASSPGDDRVAGVAAGPDAAGTEAIYVYGQVATGGTIGGREFPAGGYLLRYDLDGALRWADSLAAVDPGVDDALALDPRRGPVITGRLSDTLVLGDQVLAAGAMVAGFDPDGQVRFARAIASQFPALGRDLAVAPGGDVYLASTTEGAPTVLDDHVIANPSFNNDLFLLRLTPAGGYAFASVIAGQRLAASRDAAVDAAGAAYLLGTCDGTLFVQPEIACSTPTESSVLVSYGADNRYRWSTSVEPAFTESIAAAPGARLIVAGEARAASVNFGGVRVPTQRLFIAAVGTGAVRPPSPLPAAPAINRVTLGAAGDGQIRQGATGTLLINGTALDHVTSAQLGDIDIHVPPSAGTTSRLVLPVQIPHGHAPGVLSLTLANAGGSAQVAGAVTVTPIVASPTAAAGGRGTFSSPMSLCNVNTGAVLGYGDAVVPLDGVHPCGMFVPRGVTVRGQSTAGTIVHGSFSVDGEGVGTAAVENLTIENTDHAAIDMAAGGQLEVTDVVVQSASGDGIHVAGGSATVSHYRYLNSSGAALVIDSGRVDARDVTADQVLRGVALTSGTLALSDSEISSDEAAIDAGGILTGSGARTVAIANTTLRSTRVGITEAAAQLTVTDCTIERGPGQPDRLTEGVQLFGGTLTLTRSVLRGWDLAAIDTAMPGVPAAVSATLDAVQIDAGDTGIAYSSLADLGRFSLHNSRVTGQHHGLVLGGGFEAVDLGTAASSGNNQLENASGGAALEDVRTAVGGTVDAHGTTLNGAGFAGDVLGPASVAGAYSVAAPNTIRF